MTKIAPYWKAVVGFIVPGAGLLISDVTAASDGGSAITQAEWITAACVCITTSGAVYLKGNKDRDAKHQSESVQPPSA